MKKHRYTKQLLKNIQLDPEYVLKFFNSIAQQKSDDAFIPRLCKNGDYKMKCILHKEKKPSMRLDHKTGVVKCFGCGAAGNIFTLIMKFKKVSFFESVEYVLRLKPIQPAQSVNQLKLFQD